MLEAAAARGLDLVAIADGASLSLADLQDVRTHITWSEFVDFTNSLHNVAGGVAELEAVGAAMVRAPSESILRFAARYVLTARQLHIVGTRYIAPLVFGDLPVEVIEATDRRVILRCLLPEDFRDNPSFFHVCRGAIAAMSTLVGLPPSIVDASINGREATMEVILPAEEKPLKTLARRVRGWIAGVPMDELLRQQDAMRESYEALLRARLEFQDVLQRAPLGAVIHRDGKYLWVNAAAARMLGFDDPSEIVGTGIMDRVHPHDIPRVIKRLSLSPEQITGPEEFRVRRRDGAYALWEFAPTQVVTFRGAPARLMLGNDITERTRAREQLAISDRLGSLGLIAASVAHEINNPLTYAQLSVHMISRALERADVNASVPSMRAAASTAIEGLERVRTIAADLKTFARADEDTVGPTDLNDVVTTTLRLAQKTLGSTSKIEVSLDDVPTVIANRGRLGQVVLNLLLNAHEAIEDRGVDGLIVIRTGAASSGQVLLEVADNGAGIPSTVLARVFEPFYTTKAKGRGTGLGLSICHRIINAFGGDIAIESAEQSASELRTFARVRLRAAEAAQGVESTRAPLTSERKLRILVVDDEPSVADAIATILREAHEVLVVNGGRAARQTLYADSAFDVVLCDVMMPDLDGMQLFEEVRVMNKSVAARFVFMSGGAFTSRARSFLATSANLRLDKPFTQEQLATAIEKVTTISPRSR